MKFAKTYEPNLFEPTTYALWEASGGFAPTRKGEPYAIVMPPPNANGNLHIGHGLVIALEDILVRYYRLRGRDAIYIPGADHAGFETWVVYEKALEAAGGSRFDFSREQLYSRVWDFVAEQRGNMELQLRAMGASCSWDDLVFTLDEKVIKVVYRTFKQLWDDGLIYRGEKLVNYCTKHQTAFADIEVVYEERTTPLYYMKYGPFVLATTRPETKFGDTAVAVHPKDKRYKQYVGQVIEVEGVNGPFAVTVIADEMVDPEFGTGVVKITPAHDFNDWEVGQRHGLAARQVVGLDGKMNENAGRLAGRTVEEARKIVVEMLEDRGLLVKVDENYQNRVGLCYKCGSVIEPMLMEQWFINIHPLVKRAVEALNEGKIKFYPAGKKDVLIRYLENLKDWNISRQIPWGIPIPAFKRVGEAVDNGLDQPDAPLWIFDERVEEKEIVVDGTTYVRDEDTFDTWFSSGQWPFVVTDFIEEEKQLDRSGDLARFYPNSVMETGSDLLFPWVSRMIMLGLYMTDEVPFHEVYMHGLVLDEHGQKMSKSKGNVINPMELISEYGSDAFRLGIVASRSAGQNQAFSRSKVVAGRNLCNKLWNIARYVQTQVGEDFAPVREISCEALGEDWVVRELLAARDELEKLMVDYRFAEAAELVYRVIWSVVADWYIEASKLHQNNELLAWVLESCLRLVHPFAPFVSEAIWQSLSWTDGVLMNSGWIEDLAVDEARAEEFEELRGLVSEIRLAMSDLPKKKRYPIVHRGDELLEKNAEVLKKLAKVPDVKSVEEPSGVRLAGSGREVWIEMDKKALTEYRVSLKDRLEVTLKRVAGLRARLENDSYVKKAPVALVEESVEELKEQQAIVERLREEIERAG